MLIKDCLVVEDTFLMSLMPQIVVGLGPCYFLQNDFVLVIHLLLQIILEQVDFGCCLVEHSKHLLHRLFVVLQSILFDLFHRFLYWV